MKAISFIWLLLPLPALSQLEMGKYFSGNMMLQRDEPIPVWGKAAPGSIVEVTLGNLTRSIVAASDSTWKLQLPAQAANYQPQSLKISNGDTAVQFNNILIGDIWICLGQSNMEWPMIREKHYPEEIKNSLQPLLRFYNPTYAGKNIFGTGFSDSVAAGLTAGRFYKGYWQACDSSSFKTMSAVAWYFGKQLTTDLNIPVGLIHLSIGGAPLETFIDVKTLLSGKQFAAKVKGDWLKNNALPVWIRERGMQNIGNIPDVPADEYGKNHAFKPGFAFEAGIKPLLPMPVKGIICYQGESNAQEMERVMEYGKLTALMVNDYRKKWKKPALPFYFVQLSSIDSVNYKSQLWPLFRDEQRKMMQLIPHTGMAVSSDIGAKNDVHPTNKKVVGERLARWALSKTYHKKLLPSGPLPLKASYENGKVILTFNYPGTRLQTSDGNSVRGFSTDGKQDCTAYIENEKVIIPVETRPAYVYYGWKPFTAANLINAEGLPASTFKIKVQ